MAYHGWSNWETWNVALWLGNDEGIYRDVVRAARSAPVDDDEAEAIVRELLPSGTPDFQSEHHGKRQGDKLYSAVDWSEIATCINELAGHDEADCPQCEGEDADCEYCSGSGRVSENSAAEWHDQNDEG